MGKEAITARLAAVVTAAEYIAVDEERFAKMVRWVQEQDPGMPEPGFTTSEGMVFLSEGTELLMELLMEEEGTS